MIDESVLSFRRALGRIDNNASVPFAILFVCTGNVCRSPMAELLGRKGFVSGYHFEWFPDSRGSHSERDWRRRLPRALRYLYG